MLTNEQRAALDALKPEDVLSVYSGRPGCACGCRGKHSYNPEHQALAGKNRGYEVTGDELSSRSVRNILTKVQKAVVIDDEDELDAGDNYFAFQTRTRLLIVYPVAPASARETRKATEALDAWRAASV